MHVATLQLGEGIYQGERKLYLHFVCSLLIPEGTQKVLRWQKLCIDLIKNFFLNWMKKAKAEYKITKFLPSRYVSFRYQQCTLRIDPFNTAFNKRGANIFLLGMLVTFQLSINWVLLWWFALWVIMSGFWMGITYTVENFVHIVFF